MSAREALRIYERALDLDGPAREACLEEETRGEPALRAEVERLLGAAERAERRVGAPDLPERVGWLCGVGQEVERVECVECRCLGGAVA